MGTIEIRGGEYNYENLMKKDKAYLVEQCLGLKRLLDKEAQLAPNSRYAAALLNVEFGYKMCARGHNIQHALSEYKRLNSEAEPRIAIR